MVYYLIRCHQMARNTTSLISSSWGTPPENLTLFRRMYTSMASATVNRGWISGSIQPKTSILTQSSGTSAKLCKFLPSQKHTHTHCVYNSLKHTRMILSNRVFVHFTFSLNMPWWVWKGKQGKVNTILIEHRVSRLSFYVYKLYCS